MLTFAKLATLAAAALAVGLILTGARADEGGAGTPPTIKADPTIKQTTEQRVSLRLVEQLKDGTKTDRVIQGAEIVISQNGKRLLEGKSGPDGKFAASLPAGQYTVVVKKAGFESMTGEMNFKPGGNTTHSIEFGIRVKF